MWSFCIGSCSYSVDKLKHVVRRKAAKLMWVVGRMGDNGKLMSNLRCRASWVVTVWVWRRGGVYSAIKYNSKSEAVSLRVFPVSRLAHVVLKTERGSENIPVSLNPRQQSSPLPPFSRLSKDYSFHIGPYWLKSLMTIKNMALCSFNILKQRYSLHKH